MLLLGFWTFLFAYGSFLLLSIRWPGVLLAPPWPKDTRFSGFGQGIAWMLLSGLFLIDGLLSSDLANVWTWATLGSGLALAWLLGFATLLAVWDALRGDKTGR